VFGNIRNRQAYDHDWDGFTEITLAKISSAGFKMFHRMNRQSKITLEYHNVNDFRRGGNKLKLVPHLTDITEQAAHQINSGSVVYEYLLKENKGRLSMFSSFRHTIRDNYYGAGKDPNAYGTSLDQISFTGVEYLRYFDKKFLPSSFLLGGDFAWNDLNDIQMAYNRKITQTTENLALFTQGQWKTGKFILLGGVRADYHNLLDEIIISPRINLLYSPLENFQIRSGYSTGFRAPQAFDEDLHIMAVGGEAQLIELDPDLKPETSQSFTLSFDWSPGFAKNKLNVVSEGFFTRLNDVFVLEAGGFDLNNNMVMIRTNGECARVAGVNLEIKYVFHTDLDLQIGFTSQESKYAEPVQWSEEVDAETTTIMLRTPDNYGFATLNWRSKKDLFLSFSGIYTGSMLIPRYAGFVDEDMLVETESFFDLNLRIAKLFKLPRHVNLEIAVGMKNILNHYQAEFDQGPDRDAGFIYGPMYPRHAFFSIKFGNL